MPRCCASRLTSGARIEEVSQLNQSIAYSGLAVSIPKKKNEKASLIACSIDGALREVTWNWGMPDTQQIRGSEPVPNSEALNMLAQGYSSTITVVALAHNGTYLVAGTSNGAIHVYAWPLTDELTAGKVPPHVEYPVHNGAVEALRGWSSPSAGDGVSP